MLTFDEASHTYRYNGDVVPSVTQILAPLSDFEHVPWDRLEAARLFGTHVHQAVEYLIKGTLDWDDLDEALLPYVKAADVWLAQAKPKILGCEMRVYHSGMGYAGTIDLWCELVARSRTYAAYVDWKSSASMPKSVGPQSAAYEKAHGTMEDIKRTQRCCVLLKPNGMPSDYPLTDQMDFNTFMSCHNIYRFKNGTA